MLPLLLTLFYFALDPVYNTQRHTAFRKTKWTSGD